ncbi:unnamed protein product [Sphagnum balticum]
MTTLEEIEEEEMIRGPESQTLYPYPEHSKLVPSVILDTTMGNMKLEFYFTHAPKTCKNFIEHCRSSYYEAVIFHRIQKNMWVQTGDPTSTSRGGESIWGKPFEDEVTPYLKHKRAGLVSMCNSGQPDTNGSQFFITLGACPWLDGKHSIFARVTKGMSILKCMNILPVDKNDRSLHPS